MGDDVFVFAHTNDNCGPQGVDEIKNIYNEVQKKYPNYEIDAGTLEDDDILKSIKKLLKVGCFTKNLGGYAISSSIGLKAFETMKSIGKPIIIQIGIRYE